MDARKLIEVELAVVGEALDRTEASIDNPECFLEADIQFHLAVAEAGHNRLLLNSILLIRNLMREWVSQALLTSGVAAEALEQHKRIFLAIAKNRRDHARHAMDAHLESMARYITAEDALAADQRLARVAASIT